MTYRKKSIEEAKTIAKVRDEYICQKCGRTRPEVQIQGAHIFPVTYGNTADNPENIIALCASCHEFARDAWHNSPLEQDWFDEKFPGRKEKLRALILPIRNIKQFEWKERYERNKKLRLLQKDN